MAKTVISPGIRTKGVMEEHLVKVAFNNNEPPKNYVWICPDGFIKIWKNGKWTNVFERCKGNDLSNYITKDLLNQKLQEMRNDILTFLVKSLNNASGSDEALTKYVKEYLEPKVDDLEANSSQQEATNSDLDSRLSELESIDHNQFLTQHQSLVNYYKKSDVQNLYVSKANLESEALNAGFLKGDANVLSDLNDDINATEEKVNTLRTDHTNLSNNVNRIETRVQKLENFDHSQFITAIDLSEN